MDGLRNRPIHLPADNKPGTDGISEGVSLGEKGKTNNTPCPSVCSSHCHPPSTITHSPGTANKKLAGIRSKYPPKSGPLLFAMSVAQCPHSQGPTTMNPQSEPRRAREPTIVLPSPGSPVRRLRASLPLHPSAFTQSRNTHPPRGGLVLIGSDHLLP